MITEEQRKLRKSGLGGSDAAAAANLSRWNTRLELWRDKTDPDAFTEETADMRRGSLMEPVVRQLYCDTTGRTVFEPQETLRHPEYPFLLANLDGIAGRRRVLECKTARSRLGWGEPGSAEIPIEYLCQVQHCMLVACLPVADVAVMFGDFEFAVYEVPADAEFQDLLLEQEAEFWEMVEKRIPPDPSNTEDVLRRWPRAKFQAATIATAKDHQVAGMLATIKAHIAALEKMQARCEAHLKMAIGDNEALTVGDKVLATWKNAAGPRRFDSKRLQAEHPELFELYVSPSRPQRRFLLKEKAKSCLTMNETMITIPPLPLLQLPAEAPDSAEAAEDS